MKLWDWNHFSKSNGSPASLDLLQLHLNLRFASTKTEEPTFRHDDNAPREILVSRFAQRMRILHISHFIHRSLLSHNSQHHLTGNIRRHDYNMLQFDMSVPRT